MILIRLLFVSGFPLSLAFSSTTTLVAKHSLLNNKVFEVKTRCLSNTSTRCRRNALFMSSESSDEDDEENEIERLKAAAAALRAEAAILEAERVQALALAAEHAFTKFDTNKDGMVSVSELKAGLEKELKTELSDSRVKELMKAFDDSGDGALQLDEFVGVDKFKNKLGDLAREERELAIKMKQEAETESKRAEAAKAVMELLNDKPPTNSDKFISVLPYLFPLLDGLQYGRFLLGGEDGSNPLVAVLAILYTLYRSIPFSGFIAFFALNILSGNFKFNRLIRFNMQQAIFIDIALFFPGLITGLAAVLFKAIDGNPLPATFSELSTDAIFVSLLLSLSYCVISSLLGFTPDKLPLISKAVDDRMPTVDMFDDKGEFSFQEKNDENDEEKNK